MWRYVGNGTDYLEGVPMRDLDDDDWSHLEDGLKAAVKASPLYTDKPAPPAVPAASKTISSAAPAAADQPPTGGPA